MAEEKKKKKKESMNINLPKARASMKRQREMGQMRTNYDDLWKAIGVVVVVLIIGFILLGGINQKSAWDWFVHFGENIGKGIGKWIDGGDVVTNENGVYWDPNGGNKDNEDSDDSDTNDSDTNTNDSDTNGGDTNDGNNETPNPEPPPDIGD